MTLSLTQQSGKDLKLNTSAFVLAASSDVQGLRQGIYEARLAAAPEEAFGALADAEAWATQGGYATQTFVLNAPPVPGQLSVDPPSGQAGLTRFTLLASDFTDDGDGFPLSFAFWCASPRLFGAQIAAPNPSP